MRIIKSGYLPAVLFILFLTACSTPFQPESKTVAPVKTTIISSEKGSPEPLKASEVDNWTDYQSIEFGIMFEYPAAYDDTAYSDSCGVKENKDGIQLGHQINVLVLEPDNLNLSDVASSLLAEKGWTLESLENSMIAGKDAVTVEYRFGGTSRFGTFTLVKGNADIFALNFTAGSFCDIPEKQVFEPEVYAHMLETFQFIP